MRGVLRSTVVGFLGVAGFAATAATFAFAGMVFAVVVGLVGIAALMVRRSRAKQSTCAVPPVAGAAPVELGRPRTGDGEPRQAPSGAATWLRDFRA